METPHKRLESELQTHGNRSRHESTLPPHRSISRCSQARLLPETGTIQQASGLCLTSAVLVPRSLILRTKPASSKRHQDIAITLCSSLASRPTCSASAAQTPSVS